MALVAVYVKIVQGKLQHSCRPMLALFPCGGTFNWNRSVSSKQETRVKEHVELPYTSNELEKTFLDLLQENRRNSAKLEHIRREKNDLCDAFLDQSMFGTPIYKAKDFQYTDLQKKDRLFGICSRQLKILGKEEEKLFSVLCKTVQEIEKLHITLGDERAKEIFNLSDKDACGDKVSPVLDKFSRLRKATQYFNLIDHLFKHCKSVKHDTSVKEIMITAGHELREKFPFLDEYLLRTGVSFYLDKAKCLLLSHLRCKFGLWLLSSNIEVDKDTVLPFPLTWKKLCAAMDLSEQVEEIHREFSELEDIYMDKVIKMYKKYKSRTRGRDDIELQALYEEDLRKAAEADRKIILQIFNDNVDPIFCMVFQTRKEGYHMNVHGDPETEVLEMDKRLKTMTSANNEASLAIELGTGILNN